MVMMIEHVPQGLEEMEEEEKIRLIDSYLESAARHTMSKMAMGYQQRPTDAKRTPAGAGAWW
jgi:hypothetical protein